VLVKVILKIKISAATFPAALLLVTLLGCEAPPPLRTISEDPTDIPLRAATDEEHKTFAAGDTRFDAIFRDPDGLGPLYIRTACAACHEGAAKGPGAVDKMVVVETDGVTPAPDQSPLTWGHTLRPYTAGGGMRALTADPSLSLLLSKRVGVPVFGRGYLEAISDDEILRVEAEQAARGDEIHGKANHVVYPSQPNPDTRYHQHQPGDVVIGRLGLKARQATLDDFAADAAQGDMGLTSPLRPDELPNPDGLADDSKLGIDLSIDTINLLADYMRLLEIPRRATPDERGRKLFDETLCSVCHVASLRTRADYPIAALAGIDAAIYSDLLIHDMGPALADGLTDGEAGPHQWKTAPLIGLRHLRSYLHDGRAATLAEAIEAHAGEAAGAAARFSALSAEARMLLLDFVNQL
jgi:CxxC motif-containing protein (DUF1111 family)